MMMMETEMVKRLDRAECCKALWSLLSVWDVMGYPPVTPVTPVTPVNQHSYETELIPSSIFLLLLNPAQILKTSVHLQLWKISDWPIWLLIDPLLKTI